MNYLNRKDVLKFVENVNEDEMKELCWDAELWEALVGTLNPKLRNKKPDGMTNMEFYLWNDDIEWLAKGNYMGLFAYWYRKRHYFFHRCDKTRKRSVVYTEDYIKRDGYLWSLVKKQKRKCNRKIFLLYQIAVQTDNVELLKKLFEIDHNFCTYTTNTYANISEGSAKVKTMIRIARNFDRVEGFLSNLHVTAINLDAHDVSNYLQDNFMILRDIPTLFMPVCTIL